MNEIYDHALEVCQKEAPEAFYSLRETEGVIADLESQLSTEIKCYQKEADHLLYMLEIEVGLRYTDKTKRLYEIISIRHKNDTTRIHVTEVKKDGTLYQQSSREVSFDMMTFIALKNSFVWV